MFSKQVETGWFDCPFCVLILFVACLTHTHTIILTHTCWYWRLEVHWEAPQCCVTTAVSEHNSRISTHPPPPRNVQIWNTVTSSVTVEMWLLVSIRRESMLPSNGMQNVQGWKVHAKGRSNRTWFDVIRRPSPPRVIYFLLLFLFFLFRRSPQAENHRAAAEGRGVGPGVLGLRGEGGGPTLEGVSHWRPGAQSGHEGHRAVQEGHQPRRSVAPLCHVCYRLRI